MIAPRWIDRFGWSLVGLIIGLGLGSAGVVSLGAQQLPPQVVAAVNPQERALDANLYMQTAAESRACCLQIYHWMTERLRSKLAVLPTGGKPPAVVMDLDETVFDNSPFQTFLDRERLVYTDSWWDIWERDYSSEVGLIPGAKSFIATAEDLGVTVIYITNRVDKHRLATVAALKQNGLNTRNIDSRLMTKTDTSDKSLRRLLADASYRVLLYAGDNLRDFSEEFLVSKLDADDTVGQRQAIQDRKAKVDRAAYHWGMDWFVFPNPVYGEWQKPLGNRPRDQLRPTRMKRPAK
jgi:acid phosphatase